MHSINAAYCYRCLDVQRSICVCLSVSVLMMTISPAKMEEPTEMPFGVLTLVDPKNKSKFPMRNGDFGIFGPIEKHRDFLMCSTQHCYRQLQCSRLVSVTLNSPS